MKKNSYLISSEGTLLCPVPFRKAGDVQYSETRVSENINASREFNLVNSQWGKVSNAKKWQKIDSHLVAEEINEGEFYVYV